MPILRAALREGWTVAVPLCTTPGVMEARQVERHMPTTENEILCYLASGIIKGVGPATADRMVQRFGESTLRVLEEEPELEL